MASGGRPAYLTNSNDVSENPTSGGGITGIAAMSQSYRNVGSPHGSGNPNAGGIYDKLRNSYQNPN